MPRLIHCLMFSGLLALAFGGAPRNFMAIAAPAPPDFSRDVRPILAKHCFKCHGPDEARRESSLRLDQREPALRGGESGKPAIAPGKPDSSELARRIDSTDADVVMPPPATKNPLDERERRMLREWIAAGAEYQPHWAFVSPRAVAPPEVKQTAWPRNPIDRFVLARLEAAGLAPSPDADRYALARRVYFDLIGLPPTPAEADAFVNDAAPEAYEKLVDRLLASPHYGERWARRWLDMARYADTNGYEKDRPRSIWPYRDWVIQAFNADMPFDQFTVEQLAGDMLPNATPAQRVATGFHRNTMRNEEGGIDPLEYQFYAMTDRVATTSTIWLGMTIGCAQCHTHKYDPITQREYYQFMALLNNADEPELSIPTPDLAERRAALTEQITAIEADLAGRFPIAADPQTWLDTAPASAVSEAGATLQPQPDHSLLVGGADAERDVYTLTFDEHSPDVTSLRLEALADADLPSHGPGRTPHGNFVLTELVVSAAPLDAPDQTSPVRLTNPAADFSQQGFPAADAIDGKSNTGWAIHGPGDWNVTRTATFAFDKPIGWPQGTRFTVRLEQKYGEHHTLGKFRVSLGRSATVGSSADGAPENRSIEARRQANLDRRFAAWLAENEAKVAHWTILRPTAAHSEVPILTVLDDNSVLVSGDKTKRDVYDLTFDASATSGQDSASSQGATGDQDLKGVTSVRLEVLPDESLPRGGPGRVDYEGPFGDFFLCEFTLIADGQAIPIKRATATFTKGGNSIEKAIDGEVLTGWSIDGGQGHAHSAVFNLAEPLKAASKLNLSLLFEKYYAAGLGRFRISVSRDARPVEATQLPDEMAGLLAALATNPKADGRDRVLNYFLSVAPELAATRDEIKRLRDQMPAYPTTLILQERPPSHPRPTYLRKRGEFLQPTERMEPNVPAVLPSLPNDVADANDASRGASHNRLGLARWLTDPGNPLVARVTVNRQWTAFFGRGIAPSGEDFGYQATPPTHPELLDWLALEFIRQGWSLKQMHRLIVTSATYRQASTLTPELAARDPENRLLARGPRLRLEAEMVRDMALRVSGLLTEKIGGPSVFPPQPPGVSTDGAYGPLAWNVSAGTDRYRRGLYTFSKRTAPYAAFTTFDAPTGEICVARREVSNTALQALTMLNDPVFVEAAQTLGRQTAAQAGTNEERSRELFRRCLSRPPADDEVRMMTQFFGTQHERLEKKELDAAAISGSKESNAIEAAVWTLLARALLNLDEAITKN